PGHCRVTAADPVGVDPAPDFRRSPHRGPPRRARARWPRPVHAEGPQARGRPRRPLRPGAADHFQTAEVHLQLLHRRAGGADSSVGSGGRAPMSEDLTLFETNRPALRSLAYRMLGDLAQAEDVVQEAWLRWQGRTVEVDAPRAFLLQTVTRLCLNELDSARARREESRGDRLPEP